MRTARPVAGVRAQRQRSSLRRPTRTLGCCRRWALPHSRRAGGVIYPRHLLKIIIRAPNSGGARRRGVVRAGGSTFRLGRYLRTATTTTTKFLGATESDPRETSPSSFHKCILCVPQRRKVGRFDREPRYSPRIDELRHPKRSLISAPL